MTAPPLTDRETLDRLRLARTPSIGAATFAQLIERFGSATRALEALPDLARAGGQSRPIEICGVAAAEAELRAGAALGARLLVSGAPDFPRLLSVLDPPPPVIWTLGEAALTRRRSVAIVGARSASAVGQRFAQALAEGLGEAGFCVVSGMARGIDAAAHVGSLATGSVAVLAGGVDSVYPPDNAALYERLRARGCIVSERPPGFTARAADFPRRNRLIAGLALGVVVVEAEQRSGSLITARLAGEQGREVFAVPGFPTDARHRGANDLIRNGATLVESVDDILQVLDAPRAIPRTTTAANRSVIEDPEMMAVDDDALASSLLDLLSPTPVAVDELARLTGQPVSRALAALSELALAGHADLLPGGLAARPSTRSR